MRSPGRTLLSRTLLLVLVVLPWAACGGGSDDDALSGDAAPARTALATPSPAASAAATATATPTATPTASPTPTASAAPRGAGRATSTGTAPGAASGERAGPAGARHRRTAAATSSPFVRIPVDVHLGSQRIPAGRYEVRLETVAEGRAIVLLQDGELVARELAVAQVRPVAGPGVAWVWVDRRDEALVRVYARDGAQAWCAVFEVAT